MSHRMNTTARCFGTAACRDRRVAALVVLCAAWAGMSGLSGCADKKEAKFEMPEPAATEPVGERIARAHALAQKAEQAAKADKLPEAVSLYQQAIQEYRDFPSAWLNLGAAHMKMGNGILAVESFNAAADIDPDDPRPLYNIGAIYEQKYYYKDAIKYYNLAIERDKSLLPALRRSIFLEMQTNSFTPASKERVMRAILLETDPEYKRVFAQAKLRIDNEVLGNMGSTTPYE